MKKLLKSFLTFSCISLAVQSLCQSSYAIDEIIAPYVSPRQVGMGNVRMTTGLYEENFFNNPARVTANPESKFTIFEITPIESTTATLDSITTIGGAGSGGSTGALSTMNSLTGTYIHQRFQMILPAYYHAAVGDRKFALGVGLIFGQQANALVHSTLQADAMAIVDFGPAFTFGYKLLKDDALSLGISTHFTYRLSGNLNYGMLDVIQQTPFNVNNLIGQGAILDFDLGSTYRILEFDGFHLNVAAAVQNILGGTSNLGLSIIPSLTGTPTSQPRSFGFGVSLSKAKWWELAGTTFAIECTDIGNNANGSLFRLLHIGTETRWKSLAARLGLNQGYWTAGLGFDVHYFNMNIATYGQEVGLNAGTLEDRRFIFSMGVHI